MVAGLLARRVRRAQGGPDLMVSRVSDTVVTVCVCTYQRGSLADTLRSLALQRLPVNTRIKAIVADNDHIESARAIVESAATGYELDVTYLHTPARNISRARNACLDACQSNLAAFIDDDEVASEEWLAALLAKAGSEASGVVLGPVVAIYDMNAPAWMRRADLHSARPVWLRGRIQTGYCGNVLLRMDDPALTGLRFNEVFGQSGGEDSDFFARYTRRGGSIAFADSAIVHEPVPPDRARLAWLLKRRFRMGQTHAEILTHSRSPGAASWSVFAKATGKFMVTALIGVCTVVRPETGVPYLMRAAFHMGSVSHFLGVNKLSLYGRNHDA
ncbi:glycosyltransferase family 2 protein [Mesorhizobium sp. CAU 1741]|uniref:glycosyltransferase family 2 protein n=1 Tax=Mesorhizobium sp. CAU 1741 TaxID=3140366 RepID=UPI00325A9E57